jgi:Tripartite tricarboxylate transporter family receptor
MSRGIVGRDFADFEVPTWFAVFLPRGASEPIICKLNQAAFGTADTPSVQERLNVLAAPIHRGADFWHLTASLVQPGRPAGR